jgi:tungstate transport system substrate-binding protein
MTFTPRIVAAVVALFFATPGIADEMKLAVTTSFQNSGLSDILLPVIAEDTGIDVQLIVVGTGQAIRLGEAGDVDAILVHSREAEDAFIEQGYGTHRREIMYNDFVLIGPADDPAEIAETSSASQALQAIATSEAPFASRGDDSGTHQREMSLWTAAGIEPDGAWYRALGSGMGATLNTAAGLGAYVLSDRASWLNFGNKDGLAILFEGDPAFFNQYAYIPVNPARGDHVKAELALELEEWLVSDKAQKIIGDYAIDGQTLFTPNATSSLGGDTSTSN